MKGSDSEVCEESLVRVRICAIGSGFRTFFQHVVRAQWRRPGSIGMGGLLSPEERASCLCWTFRRRRAHKQRPCSFRSTGIWCIWIVTPTYTISFPFSFYMKGSDSEVCEESPVRVRICALRSCYRTFFQHVVRAQWRRPGSIGMFFCLHSPRNVLRSSGGHSPSLVTCSQRKTPVCLRYGHMVYLDHHTYTIPFPFDVKGNRVCGRCPVRARMSDKCT